MVTIDGKVSPVSRPDHLQRLNVLETTLTLTLSILKPLVEDRLTAGYVVQSACSTGIAIISTNSGLSCI